MTPEQFQRMRSLVERALALPAERRAAFVRDACDDDPEVLSEVEALLRQAPSGADPLGGTTVAEAPAHPTPAGSIGPYQLIRRIGKGGMGEVWEARQQHPIERTVALKLIRSDLDSSQVLARFESERQALALMNHPNIAKVLDAGTDAHGRPYFAMEYVHGIEITDYCDRHKLPPNERLALMIEVCEGVQHAHQKGIIHRDLKPSNVLIEVAGGRPVPKIIDFGVAKAIDRRLTERTLFTEFGQMIGTPEYMSPEQAEMSGLDIDTRTDVYSLGVMLYELLTGVLPFDPRELRGAAYDEMRRRIREETPPKPSTRLSTMGAKSNDVASHRGGDPSTLVKACRGDLDWITMKALEKDRTRRYGTATEFAADLRRHLGNEPVAAGPPSAVYRAQKFVRRHRVGVGVAAALALSVLLGFAGTAWGLIRAVAAERQARYEAAAMAEVSNFMVEMFEINDPGEARGATVTAREILDRARDRIRSELGDQPEIRARLLDAIGRVYRSLGLYTDARPLLEEAVASAERAYGTDHPEVAKSLNALAGLLIQRGRADEAEALLDRALAIQDRALPADHLDRARTLNNLGNVEGRLRRNFEGALPYFEQAFSIRERLLGADHPDVAKMLVQLGWAEMQAGRLDDARPLFARALETYERALGPDHPEVSVVLGHIATLERRASRFDAAREANLRSLAIQEKTLPPGHPNFVNTLFERALIEHAAGDRDAARSAVGQALRIAEGPPQHTLWAKVSELERQLQD